MGSLASSFWMTGGEDRKVFNWRKISSHSVDHSKRDVFFNSRTMGLVRSASLGTNLDRGELADKSLNFLNGVGTSHFGDSFTFLRVSFYASMSQHKT